MKNERIKYKVCPLCESDDIHPLSTVDCTSHPEWQEPLEPSISWVKCGQCEHIFTEGYFTDKALNVLFASILDQQAVGNDMETHRKVSGKMVERVVEASGLPNNRLWLDVGFGNGSLLMTAKEFGFEVFGIDLRKKNVEDIEKFGITAYHGTLLDAMVDVTFKPKPTVISMADVVEHEPFPKDALRSARELINRSGILLVSMPNASAPLWHYWNETNQNPYWKELEHYHIFTRERMYALLQEAGFKPCHYAISQRYRACMEILAEAV
jgi:SAM-dependent methyltransferase